MTNFLNTILGDVEGVHSTANAAAAEVPGASAAPPGAAGNMVSELLGSVGGVGGLLGMFGQAGLGAKAASWTGAGPNAGMNPSELLSAFPPGQIEALAEKHGVPAGLAAQILAHVLPQTVSQAAPGAAAGDTPSDSTGQGWA